MIASADDADRRLPGSEERRRVEGVGEEGGNVLLCRRRLVALHLHIPRVLDRQITPVGHLDCSWAFSQGPAEEEERVTSAAVLAVGMRQAELHRALPQLSARRRPRARS
eukprot:657159-Hanusia_phi.AAC.2